MMPKSTHQPLTPSARHGMAYAALYVLLSAAVAIAPFALASSLKTSLDGQRATQVLLQKRLDRIVSAASSGARDKGSTVGPNIWEHESIAPFDTITRIDSDSCWTQPLTMDGPGQFLPGLPHGKVYYANHLLYDAPFVTKNFVEFTRAYIAKNNLTLMNPELLKSHLSLDNLTCITYNNFEVTLVDFMLHPQVKKWHFQITNEAPFNVYKIAGEMPLNGLPL